MNKKDLIEMVINKEFIELPLCPYCGELTHGGGEFYPCCGEEHGKDPIEWVRLIPIAIMADDKI